MAEKMTAKKIYDSYVKVTDGDIVAFDEIKPLIEKASKLTSSDKDLLDYLVSSEYELKYSLQNYIINNVDNVINQQSKSPDKDNSSKSPDKDNSLSALEEALVSAVCKIDGGKIQEQLLSNMDIEATVKELVKKELAPVEKTIVFSTQLPNKGKVTFPEGEVLHTKFNTIMQTILMGRIPFLVGPAGSGKNVLCEQIAKALGVKFFIGNALSQEFKLGGFTDAQGRYQETAFYKAFTEGGLYMLDEVDASNPDVLIQLNACLSDKEHRFDFPAPIGNLKAHKDFKVICAGNTYGTGANEEYVGRYQLDKATTDRFFVIDVDYDVGVEKKISHGNWELLDFIYAFRRECRCNAIHCIVSYRAIESITALEDKIPVFDLLRGSLLKGLPKDDLLIIYKGLPEKNKYTKMVYDYIHF